MNCRNCGAAMELFARRHYYFCNYCGTFEFIDPEESVLESARFIVERGLV